MQDHHFEIIGLFGFIVAGIIFTAIGVIAADLLTVAGSVIWTLSCMIWMVPHARRARAT